MTRDEILKGLAYLIVCAPIAFIIWLVCVVIMGVLA